MQVIHTCELIEIIEINLVSFFLSQNTTKKKELISIDR